LVVACSTLPLDRHYHRPAHAEGPVRVAILEENSDRNPLRGTVTTLSNRGAGLQLFCVQSLEQFPRTALNPVAQQFPVLAHGPVRRAGEVDRPLIRGHTQHPIVFAPDLPARRNPAASSFWKVSTISNSRSATFSKNSVTQSLNLSFETMSTPPVVMTNRLTRIYRSRPRPAAPSRPPPRNLPVS
jgi:hypothetical protein